MIEPRCFVTHQVRIESLIMAGHEMEGKVAIVTGASSGIGVAIAELLAKQGAKVGLLARRIDRLEKLQETIAAKGGESVALKCDLVNREEVFSAVEAVRQKYGKIDILVNNAGYGSPTLMTDYNIDKWLQTVDVNIIGTLHCYAATLPAMIDRKCGHIVNISSTLGRESFPAKAVYSASKFFMQGHSAGMRQELASLGIKVTVIQPGLVRTEMTVLEEDGDEGTKAYIQGPGRFVMAGRCLEAEDIAKSVMFALTQKDRVGVNEIMVESQECVYSTV